MKSDLAMLGTTTVLLATKQSKLHVLPYLCFNGFVAPFCCLLVGAICCIDSATAAVLFASVRAAGSLERAAISMLVVLF